METHKEDIVADQYEKWVYPEPVNDLAEDQAKGVTNATSVRMVHLMYWPDGSYFKALQQKTQHTYSRVWCQLCGTICL